jgi:hypothetical protein
MLANRVIFVLLLAVFGISGCSTVGRWDFLPVTVQPQLPSATTATNDIPDLITRSSASNLPPVAVADPAIASEPIATLPTVEQIEPAPSIALTEEKRAPAEVREKTRR